MKYKLLIAICTLTLLAVSCERDLESDSVPKTTSVPEVIDYTPGTFIFGLGSNTVYNTIPDTLGVLVDTVYGFEGGFGGVTGKDTIYLFKKDVTSWPDTTVAGAVSISVGKFDLFNYKNHLTITILILEPNENPGPTDLEGTYKRSTNGNAMTIQKLSAGIYLLTDPGAGVGAVAFKPYILKNFKSLAGKDSLSFEIQESTCSGQGLQLVDPAAPTAGIASADYTTQYPPKVINLSPVTLSWVIIEFSSASPSSVSPGGALCAWGLSVRTLIKQ